MKILGITLMLLFFTLMFLLLILTSDLAGYYFLNHKDWILWRKVIKNFDKKVFIECSSDNTTIYNITINGITYDMYRWSNGDVSLFKGSECILSSYDEYHQKKIKKLFEKELNEI